METLGTLKLDNLFAGGPAKTGAVVIKSGRSLLRGSVLGKINYSCPTTGTAGSNTGNGTIASVIAGKKVKKGTYTISVAEIGAAFGTTPNVTSTFAVVRVADPDGNYVGSITVGQTSTNVASFSNEQISFLVTTGSTPWIAGDSFTVAVSDGCPTTGSAGSNTGTGTCVNVAKRKNCKAGIYTATCDTAVTNSGRFAVTNPDGDIIGYVYVTKYVGTGNGTITEVLPGKRKQEGRYAIKCTAAGTTHGGTFTVKDPSGVLIGSFSMPDTASGTYRFQSDEINFLITDGGTNFVQNDEFKIDVLDSDEITMSFTDSTDFIVGDTFTVTVTIGSNECKLVDADASDGSQWVYAVLLEDIDATLADKAAAALMSGDVNERSLIFGGNDTVETHRAALRDLGINCMSAIRE